MDLAVGNILTGKVTGITKFGAFVALPEGKSGLVHISEIANSFVSDVHEHVQLGQAVKVRVLNVTEDGKINLSIKRALEEAAAQSGREPFRRPAPPRQSAASAPSPAAERTAADGPSNNADFEDRLKKIMPESDSRIADNRIYSEHRSRSRRR